MMPETLGAALGLSLAAAIIFGAWVWLSWAAFSDGQPYLQQEEARDA